MFIEPHGMLRAQPYFQDDKAKLHERLPALADEISKRSGTTDVELDSFIISETRYEELHKNYDDGTWDREKFAAKHILFLERNDEYDYLVKILQRPVE